MMLNNKQMIAKMIPAVASKEKITVNAIDTVTVSSIGTPSYGIPSSFLKYGKRKKKTSKVAQH